MRILANKEIKKLFLEVTGVWLLFAVLLQLLLKRETDAFSLPLLGACLLAAGLVLLACRAYFQKQDQQLEAAVRTIREFLNGDLDARIDSEEEGELSQLFHAINTLAQVLSTKADKETREKAFLKDTISDISHQLKTPLAALNIYNGLLQEELAGDPSLMEFVNRSEQELDRIETLVQNLLKITRLDAGTLILHTAPENVSDMIKDVALHFAYRAETEGKQLVTEGEENVQLLCDRDWLLEAIDNLVKNALDHTEAGDTIRIAWKDYRSMVKLQVADTGAGIHPEDIHHIFKRFYRSRFSSDSQGLGLGLPLAKAIVEAHGGTIEAESELGKGTCFHMNFLTYETQSGHEPNPTIM